MLGLAFKHVVEVAGCCSLCAVVVFAAEAKVRTLEIRIIPIDILFVFVVSNPEGVVDDGCSGTERFLRDDDWQIVTLVVVGVDMYDTSLRLGRVDLRVDVDVAEIYVLTCDGEALREVFTV